MLPWAVLGMIQPATETVLACEPQVRIGFSAQRDPAAAAAELWQSIAHDQAGLALVFVSSRYDCDALAPHLRRQFGTLPLIGCTTAGEIGPLGYMEDGIAGLTLGRNDLIYEAGLIEGVSGLDNRRGQAFAYGLRQRLAQRMESFDPSRCFALLLIDGLCGHEEHVARAIHDGLGRHSHGRRLGWRRHEFPPDDGALRRPFLHRCGRAAGGCHAASVHHLQDPAFCL